jgi:hypothetical protein
MGQRAFATGSQSIFITWNGRRGLLQGCGLGLGTGFLHKSQLQFILKT